MGTPIMSDSEYDKLLEKLDDNDSYKQTVEPEPLHKNRIKHSKPMLSMQKAKTDEEINKWLDEVNSAARSVGIMPSKVIIRINAKLDGIACVYENGTFSTRGNGLEGNDISDIVEKGVVCCSNPNSDRVLGELVVDLPYFNCYLSDEFSNARNFVSGAVMADTLNSTTKKAFKEKAVVFQSYDMLNSYSFNLLTILDSFREAEALLWEHTPYLIDGVILMVMNPEIQNEMGCTSHHPNYAIALKPKDQVYTTKIKRIEWNTGRSGKVTPTAILEEVDIDGVKVNRATAHNAKNVIDMGLKEGVEVEIIRSGSVIPYIVGVVDN